jgi:hypothetical protein
MFTKLTIHYCPLFIHGYFTAKENGNCPDHADGISFSNKNHIPNHPWHCILLLLSEAMQYLAANKHARQVDSIINQMTDGTGP